MLAILKRFTFRSARTKAPRRWLQFRLRTLLLFTLGVALAMGCLVAPWVRERRAKRIAAEIAALSIPVGHVDFFQTDDGELFSGFLGPSATSRGGREPRIFQHMSDSPAVLQGGYPWRVYKFRSQPVPDLERTVWSLPAGLPSSPVRFASLEARSMHCPDDTPRIFGLPPNRRVLWIGGLWLHEETGYKVNPLFPEEHRRGWKWVPAEELWIVEEIDPPRWYFPPDAEPAAVWERLRSDDAEVRAATLELLGQYGCRPLEACDLRDVLDYMEESLAEAQDGDWDHPIVDPIDFGALSRAAKSLEPELRFVGWHTLDGTVTGWKAWIREARGLLGAPAERRRELNAQTQRVSPNAN